MDDKRRTTTKDVALLLQLRDADQLDLAPEFQRTGVWPRPAKAFLIDTILEDRPIPLLFFSRTINAQTGRTAYEVIDGQQRLRAVFEFYDNRFSLTESQKSAPWYGKKFRDLDTRSRTKLLNYDFVVEELSGYTESDIRDMFRRMNRYVVPLNAQEQRHAVATGEFKEFCEEVGRWDFWVDSRIFSSNARERRRTDEFVAELAILLIEGPQDKKKSVDLYFKQYERDFDMADDVRQRLVNYTAFIADALPDLRTMQLRRPANIYALVGALNEVSDDGSELARLSPKSVGAILKKFDEELTSEEPSSAVARYIRAASRQTDNLNPRQIRIRTISRLLKAI